MLFVKKYGFHILLMVGLVLPQVQAFGQNKADSLFVDDSRYAVGLEEKILQVASANKGKTIVQFQQENKGLKDDAPVTWQQQEVRKADVLSAKELYATKKQAVLILGRLNHANPELAPLAEPLATAFVISPDGLCISNHHVLSELIHMRETEGKDGGKVDSSMYYLQDCNGEVHTIDKILAYSASNDVVLFTLHRPEKPMPYLDLGNPLAVGEEVFVIAHPEQNYYFLTSGLVAKNRKLVNPANPKQRQYRMTITADYAVGSSGGPVLNNRGQVVGIVSSTSNIYGSRVEKTPLQMVLKNGIAVLAIHELLN